MITDEVFIGTFSSLLVILVGAFLWILSEFRVQRKENREDNRGLRAEMREHNRVLREEMQEENRVLREEMRAEMRELRQELLEAIRAESEARRTDTQRILEAIYLHRHDPNTGEAVFYPPTQQVAD